MPVKKSPPKLKRSASMPGKKYTNPKLAKILTKVIFLIQIYRFPFLKYK